ncbi:hypothetical protein [Moritella dasanensis]|nr:hypothetical protein [Moritella dasanensis]
MPENVSIEEQLSFMWRNSFLGKSYYAVIELYDMVAKGLADNQIAYQYSR